MPDSMPEEVPVLFCDDREDENRIKEISRRRLYRAEVKRLPIGDYQIGSTIIEFKTCQDFLSSMVSGHLENQLNELNQYGSNSVLAICGNIEEVRYTRGTWRRNHALWNNLLASYRGQIWSIMERRQIRILQIQSIPEFCDYLTAKAKRIGKGEKTHERPVTMKSRDRTPTEEAEDILCALTGVGREAARELLKTCGSVARVAAMEPQLLMEIPGIGKIRANHINEILNLKVLK